MGHRLIGLLGIGFAITTLVDCAKKEAPPPITSCVTQRDDGSPVQCSEYEISEEQAKTACNELEGKKTFQQGPCSSAGRVGRCSMEAPGQKWTKHYYKDAAQFQEWCKRDGGRWADK